MAFFKQCVAGEYISPNQFGTGDCIQHLQMIYTQRTFGKNENVFVKDRYFPKTTIEYASRNMVQ